MCVYLTQPRDKTVTHCGKQVGQSETTCSLTVDIRGTESVVESSDQSQRWYNLVCLWQSVHVLYVSNAERSLTSGQKLYSNVQQVVHKE